MSENVEEIKLKTKTLDEENLNSLSGDNTSVEADLNADDETNDEIKLEETNDTIENDEASNKSADDSFKEKFYYLAAEMDNMKKRFGREKENLIKFSNEKVLSSLLDVVDNLDRTMMAVAHEEDEKIKNICTGIAMVQNQFLDVLKKNGLETIETVGKTFDPKFHEAMAQQPAEDKEHHEIITEYQKGYILNGRLLRPAKVVITNNEN